MSQALEADDGEHELGFDVPGEPDATIVTTADPLRSLVFVLGGIVEECRLELSPSGLTTTANDPANVALIDVEVPASTFAAFEASELTLGLPIDTLRRAVSFARKRQDDPVRIDVFREESRDRVRVAVLRPDQRVRRVSEFYALDPGSVRESPDPPELELSNHAAPGIDALGDAIDELGRSHNHAWFSREGQTLIFGSQPTANPELDDDSELVDVVTFPEAAWSDDGAESIDGSIFSLSYLEEVIGMLDSGKADRLTVSFGDQIPVEITAEWVDWGFTATAMIAPRMESDDR